MIALLEVNERRAFLMGIEMGNNISKLASNTGFLQADVLFFLKSVTNATTFEKVLVI